MKATRPLLSSKHEQHLNRIIPRNRENRRRRPRARSLEPYNEQRVPHPSSSPCDSDACGHASQGGFLLYYGCSGNRIMEICDGEEATPTSRCTLSRERSGHRLRTKRVLISDRGIPRPSNAYRSRDPEIENLQNRSCRRVVHREGWSPAGHQKPFRGRLLPRGKFYRHTPSYCTCTRISSESRRYGPC